MAVYKTAEFTVRPEGLDKSLGANREFVSAIEDTEPGTKLYLSLRGETIPPASST